MTRLEINCPICTKPMDWHKGYGRDQRCCSRECYIEFDWRRTLSILGKEYYPNPSNPGARSSTVDAEKM